MRNIFYSSDKKKAMKYYEDFVQQHEKDFPSAVKSLSNSLQSCLTYLNFPEEQWVSLRTSNPIERLNKEFKRRTHSMEIVAGENSCYRLLAFISLKMEPHWRCTPIGKNSTKHFKFFKKIKDI